MNHMNLATANDSEALQKKIANSCVMVIFGIAGDLTKRLLFPALCNLGSAGLLDENFNILGVAIDEYTTESFREQLSKDVSEFVVDPAAKVYAKELINHVHYITGDFATDETYKKINATLSKLVTQNASKSCLFYFAVPPSFIEVISTKLSAAGLLTEGDNYFRRMIIEKPFGHDLESAKKLDKLLLSLANDNQIFRIDHFLGKETVENLLVLRFSNGFFEPVWNRLYIDQIQITVAEKLGVELRGNYYEKAGALRDMVPNHLLQMLSLITMEPPSSFSSNNIRQEKAKVLNAMRIMTPEDVLSQAVRGQYGPGEIDNTKVIGYRAEPNVAPNSNTETYVAMKLLCDNWRWLHVPFYIRTGKRLAMQQSEIVVQFKSGPSELFSHAGHKIEHNLLHIFIQPEEGISLRFNSKIPGHSLNIGQVNMAFKYSDYFGIKPETGYETILYECMNGDHLLFNDAEMIEIGWALVQPMIDVWSAITPRDFPNYEAGSRGPKAADELLLKDGRKWLL